MKRTKKVAAGFLAAAGLALAAASANAHPGEGGMQRGTSGMHERMAQMHGGAAGHGSAMKHGDKAQHGQHGAADKGAGCPMMSAGKSEGDHKH